MVSDESIPGGSAQTRDYYSDSSSRRRKSLDRSNSIRKTAAAVVADLDESKSVSNAKVDSNSNSLRDDCSETFEMAFRDAASVTGNGERKGSKKSSRWSKAWNIWGFIHRRSGTKDEDDDRFSRVNGVFRSNSSFVLERNRSARYSPNNIDNGLLRFYLTPLRSSRRGQSVNTCPICRRFYSSNLPLLVAELERRATLGFAQKAAFMGFCRRQILMMIHYSKLCSSLVIRSGSAKRAISISMERPAISGEGFNSSIVLF
ncbi:unnamed protein product, partial [Vitis vinifera]